ncbi:MAG: TetR/AcrR family transcriptional regulator [Deltaproteobacteria bacterium]|nr:TetR/AcrR family transcriptional regulator [Deltaproteobacteria bacterium]MBW2046954.1 TetR/AcrR family transcriptional regulator [Deltaproteobacteria bacterium]MBW2109887.1 TetR/AcrR family transcriptional regulator [Deltaproteobacteria bacterium]MBW2352767.1 TetR/AcrR family transcriptional regulator [Deltaproteobacteria bacterium]
MEEKRLSRKEREFLRHRQEILETALRLFSEKGFHNVSMQEIAQKAEFAVGTMYKFFENKEDLYKALVLEQSEKFHRALTEAIERPRDEIEKLRNYVRAKGEVFRANVRMIRLYFAETRGASFNVRAGLDPEIRERYRRFLETLAAVFANGMEKKRFNRIAEPYQLAVALDSLCNAFLFLWLETPDRHPYPEDPDVILNILFRGLVVP